MCIFCKLSPCSDARFKKHYGHRWPHEWKCTVLICSNLQNGALLFQKNTASVDFTWASSSCTAQLCGERPCWVLAWGCGAGPRQPAFVFCPLAVMPLRKLFLSLFFVLHSSVSLHAFAFPRCFLLSLLSLLSPFIFLPHHTHLHMDHSISGWGGPP